MTVVNLGATLVDLSWTEASDAETGIAGYNIYVDGDLVKATLAEPRQTSLTGLSPETVLPDYHRGGRRWGQRFEQRP